MGIKVHIDKPELVVQPRACAAESRQCLVVDLPISISILLPIRTSEANLKKYLELY